MIQPEEVINNLLPLIFTSIKNEHLLADTNMANKTLCIPSWYHIIVFCFNSIFKQKNVFCWKPTQNTGKISNHLERGLLLLSCLFNMSSICNSMRLFFMLLSDVTCDLDSEWIKKNFLNDYCVDKVDKLFHFSHKGCLIKMLYGKITIMKYEDVTTQSEGSL